MHNVRVVEPNQRCFLTFDLSTLEVLSVISKSPTSRPAEATIVHELFFVSDFPSLILTTSNDRKDSGDKPESDARDANESHGAFFFPV